MLLWIWKNTGSNADGTIDLQEIGVDMINWVEIIMDRDIWRTLVTFRLHKLVNLPISGQQWYITIETIL